MTAFNGASEGHGAAVRRVEDPPFLRGERPYTDDLREPGALYAVFVRSGFAHARVGAIDSAAAAAMPGVVGVYGAADLNLKPFPAGGPPVPTPEEMRREMLATDRVRFIGEPVAVVVAETREQAVDAAELVEVDYDPLDVVVDMTKALADDAPQLFEVGNLAAAGPEGEDALADAEVRVSARFINQRLAAVPMEPSAALAAPDPETGGFILWTPSQGPHAYRDTICGSTGIEKDQLRVISTATGGGFGARIACYPEQVVVVALARKLGRAVRYVETRTETMLEMQHGRAQVQDVEIGGTRCGQDHRPEGARDRRLRRVSGGRLADADAHRPDVVRRLRHPEGRLPLRRGGHEHDADRRLPRRGAAGGDRAGRARDGHVRGRGRPGPGRGPPAQLHLRVPAPDGDRRQLRLGRLPRGAGAVPEQRRLRHAARRAGRAAPARRHAAARDRAVQLRRVDGLRLRPRHVHRSRRTARSRSPRAPRRTGRATRPPTRSSSPARSACGSPTSA